jgi:hypothetical protein
MRWISSMIVAMLAAGSAVQAQDLAAGVTLDETAPPGVNFDKAEFRFWLPADATTVRAVVVLVPGSNGDGRPMAADAFWQAPRLLVSIAAVPGFVGDLKTGTFQPASSPGTPSAPNAWLPTERLAKAWQAVVAGR